jgi:MFS family permease
MLDREPGYSRLARLAVVSGLFVSMAANGFLLGGLGVAGREIGLSEAQVGTILSLGALTGVVTAPLWGYASEFWGRRRPILVAMPVMAAGPLAMALVFGNATAFTAVTLYMTLLTVRAIQSAFGGGLMPLTQAYLADVTVSSQRVTGMGLMSAAIGVGAVSGSALLWLTAGYGLALGFTVLAGIGMATFMFAFASLSEPSRNLPAQPDERRVPYTRIWPFLAITFFGFTIYTMILPIIGLRLMDLTNVDAKSAIGQAGIVLTFASLALVLAQVFVATRDGWNAQILLRAGSLVAFAGLGGLAWAGTVPLMLVAMIVVGGALGFIGPANFAAISLSTGHRAQGKVAGVTAAARGFGLALGPIAGTTLYGLAPDAPFIGALILVGVVVLLSWFPIHQRRSR